MGIKITINANSPLEYLRAVQALAGGVTEATLAEAEKNKPPGVLLADMLRRSFASGGTVGVDSSKHPEATAMTIVGNNPTTVVTDEPDDETPASQMTGAQIEERAKRKRRTKAEMEAARAAEAAGDQTDIKTAIAGTTTVEQPAAAEPVPVDEDIFQPPAFLMKDRSPEPADPTLQERAEALTESLSMDFVQAILGKLGITKLGSMDADQTAALERTVKIIEANIENFKGAISDTRMTPDFLAQAAIDKSKGGK